MRYTILDGLKAQPVAEDLNSIDNEVARLCMQRSRDASGAEWNSYQRGAWFNLEMSRNYFNPVEATVELTLEHPGLEFQGGIAKDISVPSLLHELGMPPLLGRIADRLGFLGSPTPLSPAYPDGLTLREVEVLRLMALGRNNRQIAEDLVVSVRTVDHHVASILAKRGAANRTEAAAYAARQGLVSW